MKERSFQSKGVEIKGREYRKGKYERTKDRWMKEKMGK